MSRIRYGVSPWTLVATPKARPFPTTLAESTPPTSWWWAPA